MEISLEEDGWTIRVVPGTTLEPGELLAAIPQSALLSARTARVPHTLLSLDPDAPSNEEKLAPTLELALCLLWEYRLGPQSKWWGYLYSLPDLETLPSLWQWQVPNAPRWQQEMMRTLRGTSVEYLCIARTQQDGYMARTQDHCINYRSIQMCLSPSRLETLRRTILLSSAQPSARRPAARASSGRPALRELWCTHSPSDAQWYDLLSRCYSLVTSRSFVLDEVQGLALCPLADVFDHVPPESNTVQLEVDSLDDPSDPSALGLSTDHQEGDGWAVMRCIRAVVGAGQVVYNT